MKSIEVIAHFFKSNIQLISIAFDNEAYKITDSKKLPSTRFKNKLLKYFEVASKNKKFIIAFNPYSVKWNLIKTIQDG